MIKPSGTPIDNFWDILQLSLTEKCNLRCRHCTKDFDADRAKTFLPFQTFQKYLDAFDPNDFDRLLLSDWGESTMMRNFIDYLRYAKSRGWNKTEIVTNGTRLDEALWDEIVWGRLLTHLIVSIESADPERFEFVRGFSFERFFQFLSMLKRLRTKYRSSMWLQFNVTSMRYNLCDLAGIVELADKCWINRVVFVHLNSSTWYGGREDGKLCTPDQHLDTLPYDQVLEAFVRVHDAAAKYGVDVLYPQRFPEIEVLGTGWRSWAGPDNHRFDKSDPRKQTSRCHHAYQWIQVRADGSVCPCCQMGGAFPIGNLNHDDFYSIWRGCRATELLDGLQPGGVPAKVCQDCNVLHGKNF